MKTKLNSGWWFLGSVACVAALATVSMAAAPPPQPPAGVAANLKPRIVFTDDPELDDNNTLIRALLYSTDYTIDGLIYSSSQYHWMGDGKGTKYQGAGEWDRVPGHP